MNPDASEPVVVPGVFLSDHVIREMGTGKLTLIGIFGAFNAPSFPLRVHNFWITVFLTNFATGSTGASIVLRVEDTSGLVIASAAATMQFQEGKMNPELMIEMPFCLRAMQIPKSGKYRVVVLCNDGELAKRDFLVNLVSPPSQSQIPS